MQKEPDFSDDKPRSVMALTVPIWAVWTVLTMMCGGMISFVSGAVWGVNKLNDIEWRFNVINSKLDTAASDRWKRSYQREFSNELRWQNLELKVPDPDAIARQLEQ